MSKTISPEQCEKKFRAILVEQLGIDEGEITPDADLYDDLGADSLDGVEIVMCIEEEFGIAIDDDETEGLRRVNDLLAFFQKKVCK